MLTMPSAAERALVVVDSVDPEGWDACVERAADGSFAHLWGWREIIGDVMGHQPLFRAARARDGGELAGVLPLYSLRSRLFGRHFVSVPFMNYGGPCGSDAARPLLAQWALDEAGRAGASSVVLRTRTDLEGPLPKASSKVTVVLRLRDSADQMWTEAFDAKFRNKIKRPQRDGMETRFGFEHLEAYYDVFARNMRDLGTPVLPRTFFERIVRAFPARALVGVTYWQGRPVAGGVGFTWRDEFEMTWSSSVKELRAAKPNMLLYWDYMRELIARGIRRFNFGRSTPGSGPHEFKLSWGGVDEALSWIHWPMGADAAADHGPARLGSAVWRHLPLRVANALGPAIARELPWW